MNTIPRRRAAIAILAVAALATAACTTASTPTTAPATGASATSAPATAAPATAAPATEAPATEAPATEAPATEAPATPVVDITPVPAGSVTLTMLVDNTQNSVAIANSVATAYMALPENVGKVTILIETRPQGTDGDNVVKTRLATNDMTDIFWYNSGSLLSALHPADTLVDLSAEPFMADIADSFKQTVAGPDGTGVYGVPYQTAMGGGILYNKRVFAENNLTVPVTWEEFGANNDALVAAGIAPVGQSYAAGSTWTSQLFVLADYCNVQAAEPDFATRYTNNQVKYADDPVALAGFQHLEEGFTKGWYQTDFGSATFDDMLNALAAGDVAQYPMLTFALGTIAANHPDAIDDIGFFGQPGTDAATNCATIWAPAASYIPKSSQHIAEATAFQAFLGSVAGAAAITAAAPPTGPYVVSGAELPDDTLGAVLDVQAYLDNDAAAPALEFLSPVKGPNLETITVAVGSGITPAAEGASQYDADVEAAAQQQGLPGW